MFNFQVSEHKSSLSVKHSSWVTKSLWTQNIYMLTSTLFYILIHLFILQICITRFLLELWKIYKSMTSKIKSMWVSIKDYFYHLFQSTYGLTPMMYIVKGCIWSWNPRVCFFFEGKKGTLILIFYLCKQNIWSKKDQIVIFDHSWEWVFFYILVFYFNISKTKQSKNTKYSS